MAQKAIAPQKLPPLPMSISGAAASGSVLQPLNSSMIAIAIVGIGHEFGSSAGISWIISAMYITTAVCSPMAGRLGSIFGARRMFVAGLLLVCMGSIVGMLAPNVPVLVAAYVVLGAGTAVHLPNAMIMVRSYAERHHRDPRTAIATLVMCGQSVAAVGPTLGGLLVGTFGWQSILWVNLPVAAISAAAILRADVAYRPTTDLGASSSIRTLDVAGIVLFVATLIPLMVFLVSLRAEPAYWTLPVIAIALIGFTSRELRADEPFLDVRALVRNRALSATLGRTLITYTCFYCVFFGIPQWLQVSRQMTPIQAGLTMLPVAGVSVGATFIGSRTYARFGPRVTLGIGTFTLLIGGLMIALVEHTTAPIVVLLLVAAVLGIPNGFNNIGNQSVINASTSVDEVGAATGMFKTASFTGANLAVVVLQMTSNGQIDDGGLHRTGWFIAAAGTLLLIGVCLSRNMPAHRRTAAPRPNADPTISDQVGPNAGALASTPRLG